MFPVRKEKKKGKSVMAFEFAILDFIQNNLRTNIGDAFFVVVTHLGDKGMIWILLGVLLLIWPRTRKAGFAVLLALLADLILCNMILKPLVARVRPYHINTAINLLIPEPGKYSFPSGHTAGSFAAAFALFFRKENKLWQWSMVLASLIAFSRMYLYVHFPTDILGGIAVGLICGYLGHVLVSKVYPYLKEKGIRVLGLHRK